MEQLASLVAHPTARAMSANFATIYGSLFGFALLLTKKPETKGCAERVRWRVADISCPTNTTPSYIATLLVLVGAHRVSALASTVCGFEPKRRTEALWLRWAVCWVLCFGCIVGGGLYTRFGQWNYLGVCSGLAAPLLLQPFVWPAATGEAAVPWHQRHCVKANVWIAIFSFIGNWWYTHYFYTVRVGASQRF
jgi:cycloeucalenol cycloisomerase